MVVEEGGGGWKALTRFLPMEGKNEEVLCNASVCQLCLNIYQD